MNDDTNMNFKLNILRNLLSDLEKLCRKTDCKGCTLSEEQCLALSEIYGVLDDLY